MAKMAKWIMLPAMIESLRKDECHRSDQDLKILYYNLRRVECMSYLNDLSLFQLCRQATYQRHEAGSLLYVRDTVITCWFVLITGSVYIDGAIFVPPNCVGKRSGGSSIHHTDCIVLESTQVIVIYYPDLLSVLKPPGMTSCDIISSSASAKLVTSDVNGPNEAFGADDLNSSLLIGELSIESDSEDAASDSFNSPHTHDAVHECLLKSPTTRTDEDIDVIADSVQYLKAFSNMTVATRRAFCAVMEYCVVDKAGTILLNDGDVVETWNVILNGMVECHAPDSGVVEEIRDSFGILPTMERLVQCGCVRTKVDGCQFVRISKSHINSILHQGLINIQSVEEGGRTVLVSEKRMMSDGLKFGFVVIRGTADKLTLHLMDDHPVVDSSYVEDFLLTYRTFMSSPSSITNKLIEWFTNVNLRNKVIRVVLLWVNNHFRDFEIDRHMSDFLVQFMSFLDSQAMYGPCSLLCLTCSAKAHSRSVSVTRTDCSSNWPFEVFFERLDNGCGSTFICKIDRSAKDYGLRYGDQIIEVDGTTMLNDSHDEFLGFIHNSLQLKLVVRCNYKGLRDAMKNRGCNHVSSSLNGNKSSSLSPDSNFNDSTGQKIVAKRVKSASGQPTAKLYKAFQPLLRLTSKLESHSSGNDGNDKNTRSPLRSTSSDPDLSCHSTNVSDKNLIKIYRADDCVISLSVSKETTVKEVIEEAVAKFGIDNTKSQHLSLYEVSIENGSVCETRLYDHLKDLCSRVSNNSRLWLLDASIHNTSVGGDYQSALLRLQSEEIGLQLTEKDFELFRNVEPTEYVDDLFDAKQRTCYGTPNLSKFAELVNEELFWVITEVCSEANLSRRAKIIQHFIKIARVCQESNNFNSLFAIVGGLGHRCVSRLHQTWDRVPSKYVRMFQNMQHLMDPSRNMSNYRNLLNRQLQVSPAIPFYPLVKKDLTFIRDGNDSKVDDLINFEKLRMMAKEIRRICNMSLNYYHKKSLHSDPLSPSVLSESSIATSPSGASIFATVRKKKSPVVQPSSKKFFEEVQMVQEVKQYLSSLAIITDEVKLTEMSDLCEPSPLSPAVLLSPGVQSHASTAGKRREMSPSRSGSTLKQPITPRFGAESTLNELKLMSLSDKVRPHDAKKNPLPSATPQTRRVDPISLHSSSSTKMHSSNQIHVLSLSPESSSVSGDTVWYDCHYSASSSPQGGLLRSNHHYKPNSNSRHRETADNISFGSHLVSGVRSIVGRHSYNGVDNVHMPSYPSSAPVSPLHRPRVPQTYDLAMKLAEDRSLRSSIGGVHARGQSLDSTTYDDDDDTHSDVKDEKRFSEWNC